MNILITSYWAPSVGGLWTYVNNLQRGLEAQGHRVDIVTQTFGDNAAYLLNGKKLLKKRRVIEAVDQRMREFFQYRSITPDAWILRWEVERYAFEAAATYLGLGAYDLIHAQEVISARAVARVKPDHVPLITTVHGVWPNEAIMHGYVSDKSSLRYRYLVQQDRSGAEASDCVMTPTCWIQRIMAEEFQTSTANMQVIPYGIDTEAFLQRMAAGTDQQRPPGKKVIAFPSRLSYEKGHTLLFEALAALKKVRADWVCWIIGDGYMRAELEQLRERLGLQAEVQFLGMRGDLPALLALADLNVQPSLQDNLPFVVMEAQLAGKALAVSSAGGISEMVEHGVTGLIAPVGEVAPLVENLRQLLDDDALRERLGANGKRLGLARWSLQHMIAQTLAVYQSAWQKKRASSNVSEAAPQLDAPLWEVIEQRLPEHYGTPDPAFYPLLIEQALEQPQRKPPCATFDTMWQWWSNLPTSEQSKRSGAFFKQIHTKMLHHFEVPQGYPTTIAETFPRVHKTPRASVVSMPSGRVWGEHGAVITPNQRLIADVSCMEGGTPSTHPIFQQAELPPLETLDQTVAVLASTHADDSYHWLYEILPRLELVQKSGVKIDKYLVNPLRHPFQRETLELLGLPEAQLLETRTDLHLAPRHLVVPTLPRGAKWAAEFVRRELFARQNLKACLGCERIFITNGQSAHPALLDESDVRVLVNNYKFVSVELETLSVRQQMQLFSSARVIVGQHGAGFANLAFCEPGTKVIEILSPQLIDQRYWRLSHYMNLEYYYLIAEQGERPVLDLSGLIKMLHLAGILQR